MKDPRDIIIKPIVSEKSMKEISKGKYVFKILKSANKLEVKHAIKSIFNVDVQDVNIINVHSKPKRLGRFVGNTPQYKKAIVTLKKGQKIPDLFEGM